MCGMLKYSTILYSVSMKRRLTYLEALFLDSVCVAPKTILEFLTTEDGNLTHEGRPFPDIKRCSHHLNVNLIILLLVFYQYY